MNTYHIEKEDLVSRVYFVTRLVQMQTSSTMQGSLTSKSDMMGGIFDRYINSLSDALIFDEVIFKRPAFKKLNKNIKVIEDFYYYKPTKAQAGIAPDIFGVEVDGKKYPFTKFENKWKPVKGTPQIEVKTFKAKDQMVSLRNQNYDDKYLVLVDLDMRIDYLVPFLDKKLLSPSISSKMKMDDSLFIKKDDRNRISRISNIDYSETSIGTLRLLSITNASDFMSQSTLCGPKEAVCRMKSIEKRKTKIRKGCLHDSLKQFAKTSPRISSLFEFNSKWYKTMNVKNAKCVDFSSEKIDSIEINGYKKEGFTISAREEGCSFNGTKLEPGEQYSVTFATLTRDGNNNNEYFMQKECTSYLTGVEDKLIKEIIKAIK